MKETSDMAKGDSAKETKDAASKAAFDQRVLSYLGPRAAGGNLINRLGREIVIGHYPADSLMPNEAVMLESYAVSRTALREAYSKLMAKGLLTARPRVGTSVRSRTYWNMLDPEVLGWHLDTMPPGALAKDLYRLRRMVEPGAAELAAVIRTPDDLLPIENALQEMEQNAPHEQQLIEADLRFHLSILVATQNPFINAFSALIHAAMSSTFQLSWRGAEVIKGQRLAQHGDVVRAIRDADPVAARRAMECLLDDSIQDVAEGLHPK